MTYLELIRDADWKLDKGKITLEEFEDMIEPLRQTVCDIEQLSATRYNNGFYDGTKVTEEKIEQIRDEIEKLEYLNIEDGSDGYDKYIEQYEVLKIIEKHTKGA